MFTCCLGCCGDGGPGHIPLKEMPTVQLDTHHMGKRVCFWFFAVDVRLNLSAWPRLRRDGSLLPPLPLASQVAKLVNVGVRLRWCLAVVVVRFDILHPFNLCLIRL